MSANGEGAKGGEEGERMLSSFVEEVEWAIQKIMGERTHFRFTENYFARIGEIVEKKKNETLYICIQNRREYIQLKSSRYKYVHLS